MTVFRACLKKEIILLLRDYHALLVLFIMPIIFIVIMSLAMQDGFAEQGGIKLKVALINKDNSEISVKIVDFLKEYTNVQWFQQLQDDLKGSTRALKGDDIQFVVVIPEDLPSSLKKDFNESTSPTGITILVASSVKTPVAMLFQSMVNGAFVKARMQDYLHDLWIGGDEQGGSLIQPQMTEMVPKNFVQLKYLYGDSNAAAVPTSVQQSVPAWLVFAMFFIMIPIASTLIIEKQQGTLQRLKTMNINLPLFFFAKIIPYYLVNQLQMVGMIIVGIYLIPLLGGDQLDPGQSIAGLLVISSAVSIAALGAALLIAALVKSAEQATTFGGVFNIILAALGGIMVPKFVMPPFMQDATIVSPMSWGLEGFLDVLLRQGGVVDVLPEAAALICYGVVALLLAVLFHSRN